MSAKFRGLQNSQAHLPFVDSEKFIGGYRMIERCREREEHDRHPTENTPWREGENYDETMSEEPFDE
jgi:hypothetical protein